MMLLLAHLMMLVLLLLPNQNCTTGLPESAAVAGPRGFFAEPVALPTSLPPPPTSSKPQQQKWLRRQAFKSQKSRVITSRVLNRQSLRWWTHVALVHVHDDGTNDWDSHQSMLGSTCVAGWESSASLNYARMGPSKYLSMLNGHQQAPLSFVSKLCQCLVVECLVTALCIAVVCGLGWLTAEAVPKYVEFAIALVAESVAVV